MKSGNVLLINTLTGAMDILEKREYEDIKSGNYNGKDIVDLKKRGYLLNDKEYEKHLFLSFKKYSPTYNDSLKKKLTFIFCPTYGCNLRCTYCAQGHERHSDDKVMTKDQVNKAFESIENSFMKQFKKNDYGLVLFGGEPLQAKTYNIVEYILKKAKEKGTNVNIITNAIEIRNFEVLLSQYKDILTFQITLDGDKYSHDKRRITQNNKGTFDIITNNIEFMLERGYRITVRINVDVENAKTLKYLLDSAEICKWSTMNNFKMNLAPVTNHGGNSIPCANTSEYRVLNALIENFPDVMEYISTRPITITPDMFRVVGHLNRIVNPKIAELKNSYPTTNYCEATYLSTVAVGPDGKIYACSESVGQDKYAIGTYYPKYDLDIELAEQFNNRSIFEIKSCKNCNISTLCGGGCPFAALKSSGRADSPYCGVTKKVINDYLKDNFYNKY